jgi:hypothetical protein
MILSTGLADILAGGSPGQSLRTIFNGGVIGLFDGTQPADANLAESGSLVGYITLNAGPFTPGQPDNGLVWDTVVNGECMKPGGVVWAVVPLITTSITWARLYTNSRVLGASTTEPRIDLSCGVASGDMRWASLNFVAGIQRSVDVMSLAIRRFL